jgi:hypothetical protein
VATGMPAAETFGRYTCKVDPIVKTTRGPK